MTIFWNIFFWLALVAISGMTAWTIVRVTAKNAEARKYVADAQNGGNYRVLAERSEDNERKVLDRLDAIDHRLVAIEKTLTDIP